LTRGALSDTLTMFLFPPKGENSTVGRFRMRFPDVLVELAKLHQRLRGLEFDVEMLTREFQKAFPETEAWLTRPTVDTPMETDPNPEVIDAAQKAYEKAQRARRPSTASEPAVGND